MNLDELLQELKNLKEKEINLHIIGFVETPSFRLERKRNNCLLFVKHYFY